MSDIENLLADYVSEKDAAQQLGISRRTLWLWRKKRIGPAATFIGVRVFYRKAAISAWLKSRERPMPRADKPVRPRKADRHTEAAAS